MHTIYTFTEQYYLLIEPRLFFEGWTTEDLQNWLHTDPYGNYSQYPCYGYDVLEALKAGEHYELVSFLVQYLADVEDAHLDKLLRGELAEIV